MTTADPILSPLTAIITAAVKDAVREAMADAWMQSTRAEMPTFLTVGECAEQLGLSATKIRSMVRGRALLSVPFGRAIRIPSSEIARIQKEAVCPR